VVRFSIMDLMLDGGTGGSLVMSSWSLPRRFDESGDKALAMRLSLVVSLRVSGGFCLTGGAGLAFVVGYSVAVGAGVAIDLEPLVL
jgi:hypothetical protein